MVPAAFVLAFAILAATASPKQTAQGLLDQGSRLYEGGDYRGALAKFKDAYRAYPSSKLWFNIGQAERLLGNPRAAMGAFQQFMAQSADASSQTVADARALIADLSSKLGRLTVECHEVGATIAVDGEAVGAAPLVADVWVEPGAHLVEATSAENKASRSLAISAGAGTTVALTLPRPNPAPPSAASIERSSSWAPVSSARPPTDTLRLTHQDGWLLGRRWTWVAAGTAVLAAGGATAFGLVMQSRFNDLERSCGAGSPARQGCSDSDIRSLDGPRTVANVLWAVAGLATATTVVLFVAERKVVVTPVVGASVGIRANTSF